MLPSQEKYTLTRSRTDPEKYLEDFEEECVGTASREFLSIKNLDIYFENIYLYHKNGGFWSIIFSKISNLIIIAFTISFSVFLIGFINWEKLLKCGKKEICNDDTKLFKNMLIENKRFGTIVILYTMVFILYFIWHLLNFIVSLSSLKITQKFYYEKLKISDDRLQRIEWSLIMNKIVSLQESIRLYHNKYLDALDITNRILRKENYMIAFINKGVLQFNFPKFNQNLLCWTLKQENRQNTNDDILRTDMKQFSNKKHKKKLKNQKNNNNKHKKLYNDISNDTNSNRHLLASLTPSTESSTPNNNKNKKKFVLKNIKSKIQKKINQQKLKFKDNRRGYQHVGIHNDEDDDDDDDDDDINDNNNDIEYESNSDVSDVSDIINNNDGIGHEYDNNKIENGTNIANQDTLFFEDYVKQRLNNNNNNNNNNNDYDNLNKKEYNKGSSGYLGNILEWNVRYIIFQSMFDDEMKVQDDFKSNSSKLKWKFFWYGVGNLILTPFTLVFRIIFFFLQNAEEMHSNKGDLFSFRQWTTIAKLKFREFNELPHNFEKRMSLTIKPSTEYVNSFAKPPHILIIFETISYISGAIVAVLLAITFMDSSILLNIQLYNRSLVWYLAIFSAILAISRSNLRYNDPSKNHELQMNEIAGHTHYFPTNWQQRCHKSYVRDEFMYLYQPKVQLFINELLNVFATPFILMFTLPNCIDNLLTFINEYSDYIDGVGDICSYARFDFKRFQNDFISNNIQEMEKSMMTINAKNNKNIKTATTPTTTTKDIGLLSPMDTRQVSNVSNISNISSTSSTTAINCDNNDNTIYKPIEPTLTNKKLESSFLTFAINNPKWRSNNYQSAVLQSITGINIQNTNTNNNNHNNHTDNNSNDHTNDKSSASSSIISTPIKATAYKPTNHLRLRLNNNNNNNIIRQSSIPSASTAQLGLTFSELLSSPRHSQMQSQFDIGSQYLGFSNISVDRLPNPESTSYFFNTLQRANYTNNYTIENKYNDDILLESSSIHQPSSPKQQQQQQPQQQQQEHSQLYQHQMMLSEINESGDSNNDDNQTDDDDESHSDMDQEDESTQEQPVPYKTLAMQASVTNIKNNNSDSTNQQQT